MTGSVQHINSDAEFQAAFKPTTSFGAPTAIFVDYFATWCGPCVAIAPILDQLARQYPNVIFLKVDVDKCRGASQAAGVTAMPTLQGFFGGQKVGEIVGANPAKIQALAADLAQRAAGAGAAGGQGQTVGVGAGGQKPAATADELRARMAEAAERRARG